MALQIYTLALGNLKDDQDGNNYSADTPVYIVKSNGLFADIYRDSSGSSLISQNGIDNISNESGEFTFYVESGQYIARVNGKENLINVIGSTYFDSRIEDSVSQIIEETQKSRGFRVVGKFSDGFTYELFNDVGIDADGNSWIYVGAGAPNKVVAAGTVPSAPDYEQVAFNTLQQLSGLDQPSDLDKKYSRESTVAEVATGVFSVGSTLKLSDRVGADFKVVLEGAPNGLDVLDAGNGNTAVINQDITSPKQLGWKNDQSPSDKALLVTILQNYDIKFNLPVIHTLYDAWANWHSNSKFPIVMVGDSTTQGSHTSTGDAAGANVLGTNYDNPKSYPSLMRTYASQILGSSLYVDVFNAGFGGKTVEYAYDNSNDMIYTGAYYTSKIAIISHSINDTVLVSRDTFRAKYKALIVEMHDRGIQPIIMSADPVFIRDDVSGQDFNDLWRDYEKVKRSIAKEMNVPYIDTTEEMFRMGSNNTQMLNWGIMEPDGLHLMDSGHQFKAGLLLSKFAPIFVVDGKSNEYAIGYQDQHMENIGFYRNNLTLLQNMPNSQASYNEVKSEGIGRARFLESRGNGNTFQSFATDGSPYINFWAFNPFNDYAMYVDYRDRAANTGAGKITTRGYFGFNDLTMTDDIFTEKTAAFYGSEVCRQFLRKLPTGLVKVQVSAPLDGVSYIEGLAFKRGTADLAKIFTDASSNWIQKNAPGIMSIPAPAVRLWGQPDLANMSNHWTMAQAGDSVTLKFRVNFVGDNNFLVLGYNLKDTRALASTSSPLYPRDNIKNGFGILLNKTSGNRLAKFSRDTGSYVYDYYDGGATAPIASQEYVDLIVTLKAETAGTTTVNLYDGAANYAAGTVNNTWSIDRFVPSSFTGAFINAGGSTTSGGEIVDIKILQAYQKDRQL